MSSPYYYVLNHMKRNGITVDDYLLRIKGDWKGYLTLVENGAINDTPFLRLLIKYYAKSIESFKSVSPVNEGILLALSVWGDEYLNKFLHFCLPSLLEKNNLRAIKEREAILFIHTDKKGHDIIYNHPITFELIKNGIQIQAMLLDDDLLKMTLGNNKYWHLGMTQSLHLQYAKVLGMDYHLMMPDIVYSSGYFQRLFDLQKPIVTHGLISANHEPIALAMENYRKDKELDIPAAELMSLSLLYSHLHMDTYFVKENKKYPKGHILIFEGKDCVEIMSPHQTIAFMSNEYISRIDDRFYFTLDSELEKIAKEAPIYLPNEKDALVAVEIRGNLSAIQRMEVASSVDYFNNFIYRIPEEILQELFLRGMKMPIDRKLLGDRWFMQEYEINAMKKEIQIAFNA